MSSLAHIDAAPSTGEKATTGAFAVGIVFFISGMPALVYQLIWQRSLFTMYGINVEAVTIVVAGFLLGLGFGSLVGGQISRRSRLNLLAVFGVIELVIGGFGILSLRVIDAVGKHTLLLPIEERTLVTLALLCVPTLFMGSTLPILSAYLVRRSRSVGRSIGLLYCVNTAGSAVACFASAFFLMRVAGMQGAVTVAASVNFLVGMLALAEAWRTREQFPQSASSVPAAGATFDGRTRRATRELIFAVVLAALVGYVALSYEIVWFRAFMLANDTSPAVALVLGTYLAGIANGSLRVRRLFGDALAQADASHAIAAALLLASVLGFVLLPLAAYSATTPLGYLYPMLLMIFLQTTISGAIFPILCHYGIAPDDRAGTRVSWVYVANILGSVAGTLVTGFILMDALSIGTISAFLGTLGAGIAILIAGFGGMERPRRRMIGALAGFAVLTIPLTSGAVFRDFYERLLANNVVNRGAAFVETVENRSGVINVDADLYAYGGGVYDGRIAIDLMNDQNILIRPFALSLFHGNPENVLMIGLATGAWEQVIASHPQVKHVTIIEINRGYLQIIRKYPLVASLLDNPKVEIVIDDGRRWLNRHPERKFDAIIQNTTWYYRPNVTNLLSREYLALIAAHLREGGIIMYNTTGSLRVQRTACTVYSGVRVFNTMVVSPAPMSLDSDRLRQTLGDYRINGRPVLDTADPRQQAQIEKIVSDLAPPPAGEPRADQTMEDCGGILDRSAGLSVITDDNMGEEWSSFLTTDPLLKSLVGLARP
jgi:spermidine synthase